MNRDLEVERMDKKEKSTEKEGKGYDCKALKNIIIAN